MHPILVPLAIPESQLLYPEIHTIEDCAYDAPVMQTSVEK
jgi:hypothetical protein